MRARTRAVAATAGAALVVVPLTGAAAAALVSQDLTSTGVNPDSLATAPIEAGDAPAAADLAAVTASEDADLDIATPEIAVKEDPPPAPEPVAAPEPAPAPATAPAPAADAGTSESSSGTGARPGTDFRRTDSCRTCSLHSSAAT